VKVEIVYQQYIRFCAERLIEAKTRSSFGKIVRQAFPSVKKRRLGPAGEQTSHYIGVVEETLPPSQTFLHMEPPAIVVEGFETTKAASNNVCNQRRQSIDWTLSCPKDSHSIGAR